MPGMHSEDMLVTVFGAGKDSFKELQTVSNKSNSVAN